MDDVLYCSKCLAELPSTCPIVALQMRHEWPVCGSCKITMFVDGLSLKQIRYSPNLTQRIEALIERHRREVGSEACQACKRYPICMTA